MSADILYICTLKFSVQAVIKMPILNIYSTKRKTSYRNVSVS